MNFNRSFMMKVLTAILAAVVGLSFAEEASTTGVGNFAFNTIVMFICAVLVIFMQAGFAMVEAGFNDHKNTVNILFKNLMDLSVGVLLYYFVGFGIMYPGDFNGIFGFAGFGIGSEVDYEYVSPQVDFLFQVAFAATAATIVSGAVAGRLKFGAYLIYSAILTALIYPIGGSWTWGGGFLSEWGFSDFAGSGIVHAVGGFAGLAGAIVLGPRIGRFSDGSKNSMPVSSMQSATLGVLILWVGWYGFNPGSQLAYGTNDDALATVLVAVNTTLAAAGGAVGAMLLGWLLEKRPDLGTALNGALGGLVAITAGPDNGNEISIVVGIIGGLLVVVGVKLLEALKIDDTVGAWPVHGLAGIWGCVAVAIMNPEGASVGTQLIGALILSGFAFGSMFVLFYVLKIVGLLRVSEAEEMAGLDQSEHGFSN